MKDRGNRSDVSTRKRLPPFWLPTDLPEGTSIDLRVAKVARECWSWTYWLAEDELADGASALEIVQFVALEVSKRLQAEPDIDRNLAAYYRTAFAHRVHAIAARNGRIRYSGTAQELETGHQPIAPDWLALLTDRMAVHALLPYATDQVRFMLHARMADRSWKEIAEDLAISEKRAKSRFYYGLNQARQNQILAQQERARGKDAAE